MFKKLFKKNKDINMKEITHTINRDNAEDINKVLSKSGIDFKELYYINHNKYFTCFELFEFPNYSKMNQLNPIIVRNNVYLTIDVEPIDVHTFDKHFDKITDKQDENYSATQSSSGAKNIFKERQDLNAFYKHEQDYKDGVVSGTVRIFVFSNSLEKLEEETNNLNIILRRNGFKGAYIQTNNLESDYRSLSSFSNPVKQLFLNTTIAQWLSRSNVNIIDDETLLLGYTNNGVFAPNQFDFKYYSYNQVLMSGMGGGKSALSKKNSQNKLLKGNHTLGLLDIHNEYDDYAKALGIQSVSFDENKHINFLQIFFVDNDSNNSVISSSDISTKVASILSTFKNYTGINDVNSSNLFSVILTTMFTNQYLGRDLTTLNNDFWFTLDDVIEYIKSNDFKDVNNVMLDKIDIDEEKKNLLLGLSKMSMQDSFLFNHKTNIDLDLSKSLRFDISFLKNQDVRTKSAYTTMLLEYLGYGVYLNQKRNEEMARENGINMSQMKYAYHTHEILIDEYMQYSGDVGFLQKCSDLVRYQRKCFSGMTIIIHSTADFDTDDSENSDLLKTMFNLCTHKFIGSVASDDLYKLRHYISSLNDNDIHTISTFTKGANGERSFMAIDDSKRKTMFKSIITPLERSFYKGGQ